MEPDERHDDSFMTGENSRNTEHPAAYSSQILDILSVKKIILVEKIILWSSKS
jgi:hypothetical protein